MSCCNPSGITLTRASALGTRRRAATLFWRVSSDFRILGVVPARGGSKGVPRKNVRLLGGQPLVLHTLDTARASDSLDELVVSTEDDAIAAIVRSAGVKVVDRPMELARDTTPSAPVISHALRTVEEELSVRFEAVMTLQPTAPFRAVEDIERSVELLRTNDCDSVVSVVRVLDKHPARVKRITEGVLRDFCVPGDEAKRRQDLEPAYVPNGAVYLTRRDAVNRGTLRGDTQYALIMPPERSVNIDEELDFLLAEAVVKRRAVNE
jgi:CMP-N,N'-diacetyllegionaminic acid synthase